MGFDFHSDFQDQSEVVHGDTRLKAGATLYLVVNESNISQVRKLFYKQFNGLRLFVLRSFCYNGEKKEVSMDLNEIQQIDTVDNEIVALLEERMKLVTRVSAYKQRTGRRFMIPNESKPC